MLGKIVFLIFTFPFISGCFSVQKKTFEERCSHLIKEKNSLMENEIDEKSLLDLERKFKILSNDLNKRRVEIIKENHDTNEIDFQIKKVNMNMDYLKDLRDF